MELGGVSREKHTKHVVCVLGKEGRMGEPLTTCEQSRASPEHFQLLRNICPSSRSFLSASVHTPGSEDMRGLTLLTVWGTGHQLSDQQS